MVSVPSLGCPPVGTAVAGHPVRHGSYSIGRGSESAPALRATDAADSDETVGAGGIGGRYLIASDYRLRSGLDFAWGPDGFAFYVIMGNAWGLF